MTFLYLINILDIFRWKNWKKYEGFSFSVHFQFPASLLSSMKEVQALWQEVRDLTLGNSSRIDRLSSPPSPLEFLRNYVSLNKPCIISNATLHWPAFDLWGTDAYLARSLPSAVSIHLTPNGRADALAPSPVEPAPALCFASAYSQQVPFSDAVALINRSNLE